MNEFMNKPTWRCGFSRLLTVKTVAILLAWLCFLHEAPCGSVASNSVRLALDVDSSVRGVRYNDNEIVSIGPAAHGSLCAALAERLPPRVGLDALLVFSNRIVFSTDVDFVLDGTACADEDLVEYDASTLTCSIYFDGHASGVPAAADLDAACLDSDGGLYLSFDVTVNLPGVGVVFDEDLVKYESGAFTGVLRGRDLGIPSAADLDAVAADATDLYFSLDLTAKIGGLHGDDQDVWVAARTTKQVTAVIDMDVPVASDLCGIDALTDSDGDWLTDFEEASGLDEAATTFPGTAVALDPDGHHSNPCVWDSDGDGMGDGAEAACGTDPLDADDVLVITDLARAGGSTAIRWKSVPGRIYSVENTESLLGGFTHTMVTNYPGAVGTNITACTDPTTPTNRFFYRVKLEP